MLLRCASNSPFECLLPIARPIFYHSGPALHPQRLDLYGKHHWVKASRPPGGVGQLKAPEEDQREREERKWGREYCFLIPSLLLATNSGSGWILQDPPLWLQLSHWTPVKLFLLFAPLDLVVIMAFHWGWFHGWQEQHVTLNSRHSSENNPFISLQNCLNGLGFLPDLRIQTIDL